MSKVIGSSLLFGAVAIVGCASTAASSPRAVRPTPGVGSSSTAPAAPVESTPPQASIGKVVSGLEGRTRDVAGSNSIDLGPVEFSEVVASSDYLVRLKIRAIGPSILSTESGDLQLPKSETDTGRLEPLTPIAVDITEILASRAEPRFKLQTGQAIDLTLRGGEVHVQVRGDIAGSVFHMNDKPLEPGQKPAGLFVELEISQSTFVSAKVGDELVLLLAEQEIPITSPSSDTAVMRNFIGPTYQSFGVFSLEEGESLHSLHFEKFTGTAESLKSLVKDVFAKSPIASTMFAFSSK